jgi:hypothetical protein
MTTPQPARPSSVGPAVVPPTPVRTQKLDVPPVSEPVKAVSPSPAEVKALPVLVLTTAEIAKGMEDEDSETDESQETLVSFIAHKGKKNARFGKNPDGTPAPKMPKVEVERKSEWGRFLHKYKQDNPDLCPLEATIEARKLYTPKSGKQKSFERMYTEVWKQKNPKWPKMSKDERTAAIRADFIKAI